MERLIKAMDWYLKQAKAEIFYHVLPTMPRYQVGDRVAQIHFDFTANNLEFKTVRELDKTERGEGGYGSTNKQR